MFKQTRVLFLAAAAALTISACGGGGLGERGATDGNNDGTGGGGAATPASLTLLVSSPQLSSDASATSKGVTVTAIVKDANNVVTPDVPVSFATPDSAAITTPIPNPTDNSGRAEAVVTTGGDPQNRTIRVTATAGTLSQTVSIQVIGTTLFISGPNSTQINTDTAYSVLLTDASGSGIPNTTVNLSTDSGNTITPTTAVTDTAGRVSATLRAAEAATTITASALGMTSTKAVTVSTDEFTFVAPAEGQEINIGTNRTVTVRWFRSGVAVPNGTSINVTATRGQLSADSATTTNGLASVTISSSEAGLSTLSASSPATTPSPTASRSIEFIAITPDNIEVQASPANISTNQTSEITAVVRDAANNLVKNAEVDFSLVDQSGGNISAATAVTNSQGIAKITYSSSSQTSSSQGVAITGKVHNTNISDSATLTVGSRAIDITIGTGSKIQVKDDSTYQLPFTVVVADSAGNPVPDAKFTLSYQPISFFKGFLVDHLNNTNDIECPNEDVNLNGIIDPSEDADGDGVLEPGRVAAVPSTITLDPDGSGQFLLTYPQDRATWVKVRLIGVATVAGTSTTAIRTLVLRFKEGDEDNLPQESHYGTVQDCGSQF